MRVLWVNSFRENRGEFRTTLFNSLQASSAVSVTEYTLKPFSLLSIFKEIFYLRSVSGQYDLFHAQFGSTCVLAAVFAKCPLAVTLRGSDWNIPWGAGPIDVFHSILAKAITKIMLRRTRLVIIMSSRMKKGISKKIKTIMLPDLIDSDCLDESLCPIRKQSNHDKQHIRVAFGSFLNVNSIKREKLAVDTIKVMSSLNSNLKVDLIILKGLERIEFLKKLSTCDILLMTSVSEGWPNIVKEALYYGLSVVSTDISDLESISCLVPNILVCRSNPISLAIGLLTAHKSRLSGEIIRVNDRNSVTWLNKQRSVNTVVEAYSYCVNSYPR